MTSPRELLRDRLRSRPVLLYGILDTGLVAAVELPGLARELAHRGVELLQLRAKGLATDEFTQLALATHAALAGSRVPLLVNDRVDVALASGSEGAHVGADDLDPDSARALLGEGLVLGVTTHDLDEVGAVSPGIVDYVGFGAVFGTQTRANARICGPEALTAAVTASSVPVVAIGGIRPDNVQALRGSGISAVAAAQSLISDRTSPGAVESFLRALELLDRQDRG